MRKTLTVLFVAAIAVALTGCIPAQAQTVITNSFLTQTVGVAPGSSADVTVFGIYVPSFKGSTTDRLGYGAMVNFHPQTNSVIGYEVGAQYLKVNRFEGSVWQPNGMITVSKAFSCGKTGIKITPLLEFGAAFDSQMHPYAIIGGGAAFYYRGFSLWAGEERWNGPYNAFTAVKVGVACTFTF